MSATPNRRLVAVVLLVPVVVALTLWAFAWPAARMAPRDLPVGVAGSAPAADQLQRQLNSATAPSRSTGTAPRPPPAPRSRAGPYTARSS